MSETINNAPAVKDDKDLKLVEQGIQLFNSVPSILRTNKTSVERALGAMNAFLDKLSANNNEMTPELDEEAKNLLVKISATVTKLEENRKPFTQIMDAIKKMFTSQEAMLDKKPGTLAFQIQQFRDQFARWCIEEEARKAKDAVLKAAIEKEKNEYYASIQAMIRQSLTDYLYNKKQLWQNSFNEITLENFLLKENSLINKSTSFNPELLNRRNEACIIKYHPPLTEKLTGDEKSILQKKAELEYDFEAFAAQHNKEMSDLKESLLNRLPAKKEELQQAAEQERLRKEELERQRLAEEKRQQELAAANQKKKKELEEKQRIEREAEQKRMAELEKERLRQEEERQNRERDEAVRLQMEKEAAEKKLAEEQEAKKASMHTATLFDMTMEMGETKAAPESRQGYTIVVTHPAGYIELISMWFNREGVKMGVDELEKITFGKCKKYWESVAQKTDEKIQSKYLKYETSVKAVNRKVVTDKS